MCEDSIYFARKSESEAVLKKFDVGVDMKVGVKRVGRDQCEVANHASKTKLERALKRLQGL